MEAAMRAASGYLGALGLAALALGAVGAARAAEKRPPNVIIILADDIGYGEYGFQGNREVPTPNIDSIAGSGVRFTQAYVSAPYCSPSRAGLMTGRYQTRFGHEFNGADHAGKKRVERAEFGLPLTERTIADRFSELGYATCAIGKWHLGDSPRHLPMSRGFGEFYGTVGNTSSFNPLYFVDSRVAPEPRRVQDQSFYTTDAFAQRAVDWMAENRSRPLFLYLAFNAIHEPLQAPPKYLERFPNIKDVRRKTFAAMMSAMDDAVGRVLEQVRNAGQEDNTLIVFFSDNGSPGKTTTASNGPLRGRKATTLEGGIRVPFCMQWKGKIPAGKTYENPIIQLDLLPTCITAGGGTIDPAWKLDGVDLMPYLTGSKTGPPHKTLYWRFGPQWAIRKGDWKLVAARPGAKIEKLFNLSKDIGEATDLSADYPAKVNELKTEWAAWNGEQADPLWVKKPRALRQREAMTARVVRASAVIGVVLLGLGGLILWRKRARRRGT
jgi:arylsulfatase A-like enzyme